MADGTCTIFGSCASSVRYKCIHVHEVMPKGLVSAMLGQLKYKSKDMAANADKSAALNIYTNLVTKEQRQGFVADFFDANKGKSGKDIKAVIEIHRDITSEDATEIAATSDFLNRLHVIARLNTYMCVHASWPGGSFINNLFFIKYTHTSTVHCRLLARRQHF